MSVDAINNILGDIGFGFSKVLDKAKEVTSQAAAKYQEISPQAQAIKAGVEQFKGGMKTEKSITPSGRTISRRVPDGSGTAIPTTKSSYKTGIGGTISKIVKKKIFGIPVVIPALGLLVGLPMLKKYAKKR